MPYLRLVLAAAVMAAPLAADAQAPDWSHAVRVDVTLANFSYSPARIHLRAGQPAILHLVNAASGGHDFTASQFFSAATVRPQDRGAIDAGRVELRGHQSRDIYLVPSAGTYPLKCSHTFHKAFGMSGEIVVD
jgi:plastocyanin